MSDLPFIGYAGDCVIRGRIDLPDETRLSDFINHEEVLRIRAASLFALEDGRVVKAGDIEMALDELFAVEAPRRGVGSAQRVRTRAARVQFELGPYQALGHVHAPAAGDPFASVVRRKPMIPLTEATLSLVYAGRSHMRDIAVLIVNRDLAQVIEAVRYEPTKLDDLFVPQVDPRARDYTPSLYGGPGDALL
jgi:hypothetical protein